MDKSGLEKLEEALALVDEVLGPQPYSTNLINGELLEAMEALVSTIRLIEETG